MPRGSLLLLVSLCTFGLAVSGVTQVSGHVLDDRTSAPIADALVSVQATTQRTSTAIDGSFSLPSAPMGAVIVAAKKGYFYASQDLTLPGASMRIRMERVRVTNDPNYSFVDPSTCSVCHPTQFAQWNGSPMANAGTNSWVEDIYSGTGTAGGSGGFVYLRDSVVAPINPNSECAACHQPELWVEQAEPPIDRASSLSTAASHGISCDVCHKLADIDATKSNFPGIWPGVVTLNRPRQPLFDHQIQYGVQGDVSYVAPGLMRASYNPQLVAEACAACHQDKNDPDHDGLFEEANGVISEPTYLEWLASPYGDPTSPQYTTCVDCHMPAFGATDFCVVSPVTRDPDTIRSHEILGTTPEYLENAVDLSIQVNRGATTLDVIANIANNRTGHHVPTGVTIRNMILLVQAWTVADGQSLALATGPTVHALGGVGDPGEGYYAGLPGKMFAKHNHDANGNGPTFFTDAAGILWDTRIPALATDTTNYQFSVPSGVGTLRVRARLIYRRAFRAFVDAKQWTLDGHGNPLEDIAPPYFGHLMEEAQWTSAGPADLDAVGAGCGGLSIQAAGGPWVGNTEFAIDLAGANPSVSVALLFGSNAAMMGATPLPLDLTPFGAPGCWINVSPDADESTASDSGGSARIPLPLPIAVSSLVGTEFFVQWLAADPAVALGWTSSAGMRIVIQP